MTKEMVVSCSSHETKVALVEDGRVVEVYVEREKEFGLVGSIYKGRVTRVLPGMQSAFVDIGLDRDAFLYVSDFFEDLEEFDREAVAELEETEAEGEPRPPVAEPTPPPISEPAETPGKPAGPEAPTVPPPPVQPGPPEAEAEEERQPPYVHHEPSLRLPETRPPGRRPRGRRSRRRRGGRGHRRHGRSHWREQPPARREPPPPAEEPAPVILPGESLAKYRERTPASPPAVPDSERGPAGEEPREPATPETSPHAPPSAPAGEQAKSEENPNPAGPGEESPGRASESEGAAAEPQKTAREAAGPVAPPTPTPGPTEEPAPREEKPPKADVAPPGQTAQPPESEQPGGESPSTKVEAGQEARPREGRETPPETEPLAELERTRRYEDRLGLPSSLQERMGSGVEWEHRREGRRGGRRRRGRRQHRGERGRRHRHERDRGPFRGRERGRRFGRRLPARPSRGQPAITQLLKPGQEIIVQIAKEQMGKKGARITSHVSLPGRYLVYMPTIEHIGVSRKIGTVDERTRLRRLLHELKGRITGGFVVRTAATGASEDDLREDIDYLVKLWHDIRVRAEERPSPLLLHRDLNLVERILRDHLTPEYQTVWIDSEEEYAKVVEFVSHFQPELTNRIKLYSKEAPVFEEMGVQREIDRALQPKVWLKSGGYIVINHTEALVAIDVNTGKFVGKGSSRLEDTIVKTNLDAVQEIVRQIRLRDLGGIIIIDFIDMEDRRNRYRVMRALEDALKADRAPSKVLAFNEFGLVAITRKRSRQSLERLLCQPCPYCTGTGMVKSLPTLCYEIQGEAKKMAHTIDAPELTIRANPELVKTLKGREASLLRELENQTGKSIILQPDHTLHFEQYTIY